MERLKDRGAVRFDAKKKMGGRNTTMKAAKGSGKVGHETAPANQTIRRGSKRKG